MATDGMIRTLHLDPATLREAEEFGGFVLYGCGESEDDFLVLNLTLETFHALGDPKELGITITPR